MSEKVPPSWSLSTPSVEPRQPVPGGGSSFSRWFHGVSHGVCGGSGGRPGGLGGLGGGGAAGELSFSHWCIIEVKLPKCSSTAQVAKAPIAALQPLHFRGGQAKRVR